MYTVQVIQYTVDFDFKDSKLENINKLKKIFHFKNIDIHKTAFTPFVKPGF